MVNSLRFKAYGAYQANVFDDNSHLMDKTTAPIVTQPSINFTDHDGTHDHNTDPIPSHLPAGCTLNSNGRYSFRKNGHAVSGTSCEDAIAKWYDLYGSNEGPPVYRPVPPVIIRPSPPPIIINLPKPRLPGTCIKDGHNYIFKGRVVCENPHKSGCTREVIGSSCSDAISNFCKLYGLNGKCVGDPATRPQSPVDFRGDKNKSLVIKIIDDDAPGGTPVDTDAKQQADAAAKAAAAPPVAAVAPAIPPSTDISGIFAGSTMGVPNIMLIGGGALLLFMVLALKK